VNRKAGLAAILLSCAAAQSLQFEVAAIRPSTAAPGWGTSFETFEGGRVRITNEPVKLLIRVAFQLQNSQIVGGPAWLDSEPYDIEAKAGLREKPGPEQLSPMMRNLLEDRFHLKFHREKREMNAFALVVASGGSKLQPAAENEVNGMKTSTARDTSQLMATATSMRLLASYVGNRLGRIVVDQTGLSGVYDFKVEWAPDQATDSSAPSLVTALREQLGLKVESQKVPLEILVIDRIDRPE